MIKKNLASNFLAKFWNFFFSIVFLPLYIRFLGIEAYGLIGFYGAFFAILSLLLDMGLSTTANREMAIMMASSDKRGKINNFARTLEVIYWVTGLILAILFFFLSPWISQHWFNASHLTSVTIEKAVICMGFSLASLWPFGFYAGSLIGLEKQTSLNLITCSFTAIRSLGTLAVLAYISCSIEAFFIWQAVINLAQTVVSALFLWRNLPKLEISPKFELAVLKNIWGFTAGISGISLTILILTQLDKILLSKLLPLEAFSYYSFAYTIANGLSQLTGPVATTFFPRFSQHVAKEDELLLSKSYHLSAQLISCLILPMAACLICFPNEILGVWGINSLTIQESSKLISLLVIGTTINSLLSIPYIMQLSYGWTRLPFLQNVISIIILIGPLIWAVKKFGSQGAAYIWILLNFGYLFITIPIMHRKILKSEMKTWYLQDGLFPLVSTFSIVLLSRLFLPSSLSRFHNFCLLSLFYMLASLACILSTPLIRSQIFNLIKGFLPQKETNS